MRSRGLRQQLERVGLLDVLGEHEHRGVGVLGADPLRRAQALIGVGRRHAHVDHGDVGRVRADLAQQVVGVARLADDLDARLLQQPCDSLTQQHGVVGNHRAHLVVLRFTPPRTAGAADGGRSHVASWASAGRGWSRTALQRASAAITSSVASSSACVAA